MSEIKPVIKTAEQRFNEDCEVMNLICVNDINQVPYFKAEVAELRAALEALQAENELLNTQFLCVDMANKKLRDENAELKEDLQFVERWANHHGTKPNVTAQESLSCIQHYPSIEEITKSYKDGVIPNTRNPYAEIEALRKQVETAVNRINDMLQDDDGQAHKEARKFVESLSAQKGAE